MAWARYTILMKVVRQPSAFAAVSELRTRMDEILAQLKETPVTLEKHNKEVAILEDPRRYAAMQEALEDATDILLAFEARERMRSTPRDAYIPLREAKKRLK